MQFLDYESDEERAQQEKFTFSRREESIAKLKCASCTELPTDVRATFCCQEHVCLACFEPIKQRSNSQRSVHLTKSLHSLASWSGETWYACQFCGTKLAQEIRDFDTSFYLRKVSKLYQQKLESVLVICPDKNCKKKIPYGTREKHWESNCDRLVKCKECGSLEKLSDNHVCPNVVKERIRGVRKQLDAVKKEIRDFNLRYPFVNPLDGNESDSEYDSDERNEPGHFFG